MKLHSINEKEQTLKRMARNAVFGEARAIRIGRSSNVARVNHQTFVEITDDDSAPRVLGSPYLKTIFRNGSFTKTLYTPSTMRVRVGRDWNPYDNDNH